RRKKYIESLCGSVSLWQRPAGCGEEFPDLVEYFTFPSARPAARRQRVQENPAVLFLQNTPVEDHDRSAIGPRPDETAETLFEPDHRLRDAVFEERISTAPLNRLHTSLHYRFLRHAEGEFRNDDI